MTGQLKGKDKLVWPPLPDMQMQTRARAELCLKWAFQGSELFRAASTAGQRQREEKNSPPLLCDSSESSYERPPKPGGRQCQWQGARREMAKQKGACAARSSSPDPTPREIWTELPWCAALWPLADTAGHCSVCLLDAQRTARRAAVLSSGLAPPTPHLVDALVPA